MSRFVEVSHLETIAAPVDVVRSQFADLQHHIAANVHPKLRFEVLSQRGRHARYVQEVRLLGVRQRDVLEREIADDGLSMTDTVVEGFNKGGSLSVRFAPQATNGHEATRIGVTIRLPVPALLGFLSPLLKAQVRRELLAAVQEDKNDIELRGYPARTAAA
ncbi:MAG TPA: hypothetical protein VGP22_10055 [Albitalea sp.]|jgi:hypothetical protein|nr:hypothetical protein [Albitalea sp.]